MQASEYQTMRDVEDHYWWYRTLRKMVVRELAARAAGDAVILDAGCGTGGMLQVMRERQPAWGLEGIDFSPHAIEHTKARGFENVRAGSIDDIPIGSEVFDAVVSLDVLYFRGIDRARAMKEFHRVLKPGGVLILNLPAFECLRGSHDIAVATEKRFDRADVKSLLAGVGFEIETVRFWNAWLFLPIFLWRQASRLFIHTSPEETASDLKMPPRIVNELLAAAAGVDARLCALLHIPFGTSVFSVARKSKAS